jgi:hypothetical protein
MGLTDLREKVDFTPAFAMVHEFPDGEHFFNEVSRAFETASTPAAGGAECGHVDEETFPQNCPLPGLWDSL